MIEPREQRLTHLVVEEPEGRARLVPARLLRQERKRNRAVVLSCSTADVLACESIRSFVYVGSDGFPQGDEKADVGVLETIVVPSFDATEFGGSIGDFEEGYGVTYDRIPTGHAELRRTSSVLSSEGDVLGHVDGLLLTDGRLTHVVLQTRRHCRRTLAIPIEAVESIETDRITLTMSKDAVDSFGGSRSHRLPLGRR